MIMKLRLILVLSSLLAVIGPPNAQAQHVVLDIQERDIYIDMGHQQGLAVGGLVTLQHVIRATHPVTKKRVRDTFPLGQMRVRKVGPKVSIVHARQALHARVRVGDEVTLASEPVVYVDPWTIPATALTTAPTSSSDALYERRVQKASDRIAAEQRVEAVWKQTLGQSPQSRLDLWSAYVNENPNSPFLRVVKQNADALRRQISTEDEMATMSPELRHGNAALQQLSILSRGVFSQGFSQNALAQNAPTRVYQGEDVALALLSPAPSTIAEIWLYYRQRGSASYEQRKMQLDGDGYLRGTIPGKVVVAPSVEYFIEVLEVGAKKPTAVLGTSAAPKRVLVDASVEEELPDRSGHSRVTLFTDYVDFDGFSKNYDQYIHAEVDFMYRFFSPIYSLRLGFGTMSGVGGPKDVIDLDEDCTIGGEYQCHRVGYNYAFTETEHRFGELFAVMARVQWGSAYQDSEPMEGVEREFFDSFGIRGRIRLGSEVRSNLVLGVSTTQRLGSMYEGAFTWDVIPKFPVVLSVQVTDQPVLEDFGVRLISDVGWRHFDWVYPSLRIAYQARDIDHAGLSAGLAANFDW